MPQTLGQAFCSPLGPVCAPYGPFFLEAIDVIESACDDFEPPG